MDEEKTTNLWAGTTYGRSIEQQKNERTIKITGTIAKHTDAPKTRPIPVTTYHPDEQQTTEKGRINMANGKPGRPPKFQAPKPNAYNSVIQSSTIDPADPAPVVEYYRFNAKLPIEQRDYLQEMAWRNRTTITAYISHLIEVDMQAHPEWKETIDLLNR